MYPFSNLICLWKGHKFGHAKDKVTSSWPEETPAFKFTERIKKCSRCGHERTVKQRKPKVQP